MLNNSDNQRWYERIPHALTILFCIIIFVTILTYLIPAGAFERELVDGRLRVIPGSFKTFDKNTPISLMQMFTAIPLGFKAAVEVIFIVLAGGIMFGIMEKSTTVENAVGALVKKLGLDNKYLIVIIMTYLFGSLGIAVGYENNIALVPIAAVLSLALGGDLVLAAGISVGAMTIGFGLSPINPYTVGTGHKIAELPMFSGYLLRSILCFTALSLMAYYNVRYFKKITKDRSKSLGIGLNEEGINLSKPITEYAMNTQNWMVIMTFLGGIGVILYGVNTYHWFLNELSAIFLIVGLLSALISKMDSNTICQTVLNSVAQAAPGAFMVGFATTIKVLMEMGNIGDSISNNLAELLQGLPLYLAAISMSISQCVINLFIPSGSGQALATLPIMLPLGEVLGLTRQTTILAFQIGDGVTNLINPTLGGLVAMLAMCRVPLDRWFRFIIPMLGIIVVISWIFLLIAVAIEY